jgi:hypothetical protein
LLACGIEEGTVAEIDEMIEHLIGENNVGFTAMVGLGDEGRLLVPSVAPHVDVIDTHHQSPAPGPH